MANSGPMKVSASDARARLQTAPSMPSLSGPDQQQRDGRTAIESSLGTSMISLHSSAAEVCQKLDVCLSRAIPGGDADELLVHGPQDLQHNVSEYVEAAKWLEAYFVKLRETTQPSPKATLQK
eukprot:scaffold329076_cov45-Prasinocladus_malaysianus.AAC.1